MRLDFEVDKEKAALHGVSTGAIVRSLRIALSGESPATLHRPEERASRPVRIRLPAAERADVGRLAQLPIQGGAGSLVDLAELGRFVEVPEDQPIYHKNLERVVFVVAEMAGRAPAEAILDLSSHVRREPAGDGIRVEWAGEGEWEVTLRVFRDLGLAFGGALVLIYILVVLETNSFLLPLVIMTAIPLTAIGILPGFWLLNAIAGAKVGPFADPIFFTATGMIGMIGLGGIVVRNSIVLIEFIREALREGMVLREAILESGAVRMRPIFLTASTTVIGAWPITFDPIFSGLAWALIFGLVASTAFTLLVVPIVYWLIHPRAARQAEESQEVS